MKNALTEMLHLSLEPVGIFFGNTSFSCDFDADPEKRNCVIPLLMAAAKGKTISMNEESCNCAGGATGCCFGDGFSRRNPNIHKMLAQGLGDEPAPEAPEFLKSGERFFCSEELALQWRSSMPYSDRAYPRIVFAPLHRWEAVGRPDLVYLFVNADQISALVTMLGSHNGHALNTLAPFVSACQSIVYAAAQLEKEEPMAVMGLFDISQRRASLKDYLTLTMPCSLWDSLNQDLDKSCLTTQAWAQIAERL